MNNERKRQNSTKAQTLDVERSNSFLDATDLDHFSTLIAPRLEGGRGLCAVLEDTVEGVWILVLVEVTERMVNATMAGPVHTVSATHRSEVNGQEDLD